MGLDAMILVFWILSFKDNIKKVLISPLKISNDLFKKLFLIEG